MPELKPGRVTLALAFADIAVFLAMLASGVSLLAPSPVDLVDWGALLGPLTIGHEWWRIGTAIFLHVGAVHLVLNLLCLLSLGPMAEAEFGPLTFLAGYLLAGLGGSLASLAIHPGIVGAGASGAIFGIASWLLVAGVVREYRHGDPGLRAATSRLGLFLIANLGYGLVQPEIDNAAHLGGLATGALLGLTALARQKDDARAWIWPGMVGVAGLLVLAAIGVAKLRPFSPDDRTAVRFEQEAARLSREVATRTEAVAVTQAAELRDSISGLQAAIRKRPDSAEAYARLAEVQALRGKTEAAEQTLLEGLARAPGNPGILAVLGTLRFNEGRFADAVVAYEQVLAADTNDAEARYNLAFAYQALGVAATEAGDRPRAKAAWTRVLQLHADAQMDEIAARNLGAPTP